jgi:diguanylate cyclase (GGDEF)-like protein
MSHLFADSKKSFQLSLIYLFAAMATLGVTPFCVMRYLQGEYLKAALDFIIILIAAGNALFAYRTQSTFYPSVIAATIYSSATVAIVYLNSPLYVFWVFPAISANFFLLRPALAILFNSTIALAILPIAISLEDSIAAAGMLASLMFAASMTFVFAREANKYHDLLQTYATQDPLTQLDNRRAMNMEMQKCIEDLARSNTPASIIILDLDYFKAINDSFGHKHGDTLLIKTADILRLRLRKTDRVFRYGGEEFVLLARNTNLEAAQVIAENLRNQMQITLGSPPHTAITASFGCAQLHANELSDQWFERADKALYQAKEKGRNQVAVSY